MKLHEYLKLLRKRHIGWLVYVFSGAKTGRVYVFKLAKKPDQIENDPELSNAEVIACKFTDEPACDIYEIDLDIVITKGECNG